MKSIFGKYSKVINKRGILHQTVPLRQMTHLCKHRWEHYSGNWFEIGKIESKSNFSIKK